MPGKRHVSGSRKTSGTISRLIVIAIFMAACSDLPDSPTGTPPPSQAPIHDWTIQRTGTLANINDIFFINNSSGWAVGDQQIVFSTVDGGQTWPLTPIGSLERNLYGVHVLDSDNGWIAGGGEGEEPDGYLFHSVNGGAYAEPKVKSESPLHTIFFLDEVNGWAGGDGGIILQTNDGVTWTEKALGEIATLYDLHFLTPSMGWAATSDGLYVTEDGSTWSPENDKSMRAAYFVDDAHGWACGDDNLVMTGRMNPEGEFTWTEGTILSEAAGIIWSDIYFIDENNGWIVGEGGNVWKTSDGGEHWVEETTGLSQGLNAIHMLGARRGWIAGDEGVILTYTPR